MVNKWQTGQQTPFLRLSRALLKHNMLAFSLGAAARGWNIMGASSGEGEDVEGRRRAAAGR